MVHEETGVVVETGEEARKRTGPLWAAYELLEGVIPEVDWAVA